jgi:signal transduction histidine kinase
MKEEYQFSNEEVDFYSTLAGQAAMAIYNSYLYEETRGLARELMTANKVKSEFLSVMSHELRTPLHVIMGHTGMVCDKMLGELNERQVSSLVKVMSSSRELLSMISSILEATRMEAEAVKVDYREFSAEKFLGDLQSSYNVPMDKDLALNWDYPSNLPLMNTDRGKLQQILQNLINNAIKFTEKGFVTISAKYLSETGAVEFKVSDTGIGIPEKAVPLIFEKFRQIDSSDTRQYGGVGLGLYIIKQFTDLLGGTVRVESETGKGSTFVVTVPV